MWPTLFKLPLFGWPIRGYGLMLMVAFVGGTWWAARRAARVKYDPDFVVNLGFIALLSSIIGARIFYVVHYWEKSFAGRGLWAVVNVTGGGLEFYGGFIGAMVAVVGFTMWRKQSLRLTLDILAPSLMFGMGMARIGCFLNGCCWGGPCPHELAWAVRFPYGSPAAIRQWENRQITLPAELVVVSPDGLAAYLIQRDELKMTPEYMTGPQKALDETEQALKEAQAAGADSKTVAHLKKNRDAAAKRNELRARETRSFVAQAQKYGMTATELDELAGSSLYASLPVHPVQLYASLNALFLAAMLNALFYRRKRHGVVFGLLMVCYPIMRVTEEIIRSDNPHDTLGLTVSQFVSVTLLACGIIWIYLIHQRPLRSPRAVAFVPPPPPEPRPGKKGKK